MVKVGKYDTFQEYLQSYRAQGLIPSCHGPQLTVDWIRLVIVVGGYILLRPLLVRYAAKLQQQNLEKEDTKVSTEGVNKEKEQDNKARKDLQWGASARIRQRKVAEGQMQGGEDTDDEDLKQLLE
jgi:flagellar biosynthesis/type III secretory pathway M-ring protein FliF/YscJ